jgi:hypothetical protein
MRLQRAVNLHGAKKTYYRWQLFVPADLIGELGWRNGDELRGNAAGGKLVLTRVAKAPRMQKPQEHPRQEQAAQEPAEPLSGDAP